MQRALLSVPVGPAEPAVVTEFTRLLRDALEGSGPALAPIGPHDGRAPDVAATVPERVALVVSTSGSTGEPRRVMLDAEALLASACATHERLGGPGRWVLALPAQHIAGLQVLIRSVVAGALPAVLATDRFDPVAAASVLVAARHQDVPVYTALVPTQLHRILARAEGAALPAELRPWTDVDAILVGGAATAPGLLDRARDVGLRIVTTYGMTETAGGCVYDGVPLTGVRVRIDGTVHLAGPVLARGYLDRPDLDTAFQMQDGVRWFRTGDLGTLARGVLHVRGRADDVVVTGGVKVTPTAVEAAIAAVRGVAEVCVVGVPDDEWGQLVTAVVVPVRGAPAPTLAALRDAVVPTLGPAAAPRRLVLADALPQRGPGKVDRTAVTRQAAADADGSRHGDD